MVTVKLEICFENGQFFGVAKNLHDQPMRRSNLPAINFVNMINFAREFWKILE